MMPRSGRRQCGAALLSAMLTVALVATFAAAALWQQWRSVEVETAERARVQAEWILAGGLDWARLVLREDAKAGGQDWLGEPWAVPLQEARLSSFLAADRNVSTSADSGGDGGVLDAFLSGQIVDLQSLMNVTNLVHAGKVSDQSMRQFARLFGLLGLPQGQLQTLAENLRLALDTSGTNGSSPLAPLVPQRVEQLVWLGLPETTVAALAPYVTVLPLEGMSINLNTASAEVLQASIGISAADAQRLVALRANAPFRSPADAARAIGADATLFAPDQANAGVTTRFFEVRSRLRLDKLVVEEHSVVQRDGMTVQVLQRWRTAPTPDTPASPGTPAAPAADAMTR